jgi:tetratricopeptide (TPR) repeat protein
VSHTLALKDARVRSPVSAIAIDFFFFFVVLQEDTGMVAGVAQSKPENAGLFLRQGDTFFNEQRYQEAIGWYEQATEADPSHSHAFTMLAAAHYMAGGVSAAIKNFDRALDIEPTSLNALLRSGQLHLQVCNLNRSEEDMAAILRINPQHTEAQAALKDVAAVRQRVATVQVCCIHKNK